MLINDGIERLLPVELTADEFKDLVMDYGTFFSTEKHVIDDEGFVQLVSHDGLFERGEVPWHNDWSYGVGAYHGTALYNFFGGHLTPTWFVDMKTAYIIYQTKKSMKILLVHIIHQKICRINVFLKNSYDI